MDDAIIAVETVTVKLEQGWDHFRAGSFACTSTAFPMLTGTLVTAAGYLPVGLAQSSAGEYTQDIFRVAGMALIVPWLVGVLFVPFLGAGLLSAPKPGSVHHDPYGSRLYRRFRRVVGWGARRRWIVIGSTVAAFAFAAVGFTRVPQQFFPAWGPMAIAIMGGLVSATVLTLFFVPALYAAAWGVARPATAPAEVLHPAEQSA